VGLNPTKRRMTFRIIGWGTSFTAHELFLYSVSGDWMHPKHTLNKESVLAAS